MKNQRKFLFVNRNNNQLPKHESRFRHIKKYMQTINKGVAPSDFARRGTKTPYTDTISQNPATSTEFPIHWQTLDSLVFIGACRIIGLAISHLSYARGGIRRPSTMPRRWLSKRDDETATASDTFL